jgi:hypothetical protein
MRLLLKVQQCFLSVSALEILELEFRPNPFQFQLLSDDKRLKRKKSFWGKLCRQHREIFCLLLMCFRIFSSWKHELLLWWAEAAGWKLGQAWTKRFSKFNTNFACIFVLFPSQIASNYSLFFQSDRKASNFISIRFSPFYCARAPWEKFSNKLSF